MYLLPAARGHGIGRRLLEMCVDAARGLGYRTCYLETLAQMDLWKNKEVYAPGVYVLPKKLDEEVARLHLDKIGAKLTSLTPEQADYIGVPVDGPYKPEHYRY